MQFSHCLGTVRAKAAKRLKIQSREEDQFREQEDGARLKHVIWDLILERVLIPSTSNPNSLNDGWPFLSVTDHGRKVIAEQKPTPYDPDGYLARLNQATGGLSDAVREYLSEAIATFRTGNNLASAVMLGAASEMLFLELCNAITASIQDPNHRSSFQKKTEQMAKMSVRLKAVDDWLSQKQKQLPADWQSSDQREVIDGIAILIRKRRNESGHPQSPTRKPPHEDMYALLMMFPNLCQSLYSVKTWLEARPASIT